MARCVARLALARPRGSLAHVQGDGGRASCSGRSRLEVVLVRGSGVASLGFAWVFFFICFLFLVSFDCLHYFSPGFLILLLFNSQISCSFLPSLLSSLTISSFFHFVFARLFDAMPPFNQVFIFSSHLSLNLLSPLSFFFSLFPPFFLFSSFSLSYASFFFSYL